MSILHGFNDGENDVFTFTWQIENILFCDNKMRKWLQSPDFVVDAFSGSKWYMALQLESTHSKDYLPLYLFRSKNCVTPADIHLVFEILIPMFGKSRKTEHLFREKTLKGLGFINFLKRDELLQPSGTSWLPLKKTLTILCRMRMVNKKISNCLHGENLKTWHSKIPELSGSIINYGENNEGMARTHIGIERVSFTWNLEKFSAWRKDQNLAVPVKSISSGTTYLVLVVRLTEDEDIRTESFKKLNTLQDFVMVNCVISVVNVNGKTEKQVQEDHDFQKGEEESWYLPNVITKSEITSKGDMYFKNGALTMRFEFVFSKGVVLEEIERSTCVPSGKYLFKGNDLCGISQALKRTLQERKHCDITLLAGSESIPAHKAILSVRSPVFEKMFDTDMREKETKMVDITDVDAQTLKRMLLYMYSENLEELDLAAASKLYSACDKYEFVLLMEKCAQFFKLNLSVDNVIEVLCLADAHHDNELKSSAIRFVCENVCVVFKSDQWKIMVKEKVLLASEVLSEVTQMYQT